MKITIELDELTADALARVDRVIGHNSRHLDPLNPDHKRPLRGYQARTARRIFEEALFCVLDVADDHAAHPSRSAPIDPLTALRFALVVDRRQPCRSSEHIRACEAAERALQSATPTTSDETCATPLGCDRQPAQAPDADTERVTIKGASIDVPRTLLDAARRRAAEQGETLEVVLARLIARDNPPR